MSHLNRRNVRKRATQAVMVSNAISGDSLGRIGNLSIDGMMLIGNREFFEEHYYQIQFSLSSSRLAPQKVEIGLQCLWAEQARAGRSYWGGFKLIDASEHDLEVMRQWIDEQAVEA
jgi:hypothetical protein